jgi:hypothetical protein
MTEAESKVRKPRHRRGIGATQEVRIFTVADLEVRDMGGTGNTVQLFGTPIVYDSSYVVRDMIGEFEETMLPGVMSKIIDTVDCRFLVNHEGTPLARTSSGTMQFVDTRGGLQAIPTVDIRSTVANDLVIAIDRGDITQMSCGFIVANGGDEWSTDWSQRRISAFSDLLDVSAVTYPASPTTTIDLQRAAHRAAQHASPFERARVQKMWAIAADLRAGKALSASNAQAMQSAVATLHTILSQADPNDLAGSDDDASDSNDEGSDDGTDANVSTEPADADDGAGSRSSGWKNESRSVPATASELRVDGSFNDITSNLEAALQRELGDNDGDADLWVCDAGPDWVVWQAWESAAGMGLFMADWSTDADGNFVFENGTLAERVTTYVTITPDEPEVPSLMQSNSADEDAEKRAAEARKLALRAKIAATVATHR